jgi:molecular chaperone DnaK
MVVTVTREQFEDISRDLVQQCLSTCELVLDKAGMHWEDLEEVLLVGGATRMPMIRQVLRRRAGELETSCLNPEACVAMGAALAGVLRHQPDHPALMPHRQALARRAKKTSEGRELSPMDRMVQPSHQQDGGALPMAGSNFGYLPPVTITDVTSQTLGIVVLDSQLNERVITLIPDGTALPCEERGRFAYAYNNMTAVRVEVTEGSGITRDQVQVIGEVVLSGLPPRPKGTPIEVIYRYGQNQILEIDVIDVDTRRVRRAQVDLKGGMDPHTIEKARRTVASFQVH